MLTPEQLLHLPDNLVRLYAQLEEDILADMAARISARDLFISATDWQFQKLAEMGNTYEMILVKLSAATEKTEQELRDMMTVAASESLKYDDAVHKAAGKDLPPLNQSAALLATLNAGMEKTKGYFQNLCRTTANQGSKQFVDALDRAYMQVTSGAFTKEQAIKTAVKDLAGQGIAAAEYKNGRKMNLEAAVRMNVVTGVNQTCAELQLQRCDEAGCDLVEVSAHAGARPSHAVWQGKLYSRSGTHPKYPDFALSTGYGTVTGLCGANCRHNFYPFYEGISKRAYTHRELGQMNARTIRYNGQRLTEYEASQVQRKIERNLRRWKREQAAMKAAGQSTAEAAAKLKYWHGEMDSFIRQTGFKRQYSREEIFGKTGLLRNHDIAGKAVVNRDGKEIVFAPELGSEKWEKTQKVLVQLAGEYNTKLVEVRVFVKGENTARAAGDVDPFGLMRLSSKNIETAVHEFAHSLTTSTEEKYGVSGNPAFWKEIKKVRKQYKEHTRYNPSDVISWYADDKLDEFYAEAFCHAKLREMGIISDKYGTDFTFSQKVLDITDKYFKKKQGRHAPS